MCEPNSHREGYTPYQTSSHMDLWATFLSFLQNLQDFHVSNERTNLVNKHDHVCDDDQPAVSANNLHSDFREFLTVDEEKQEQQQHLHPPVKSTPAQMPLNTRTLLCSCWCTNQTFLSASAVCLWQETTESWYEIKKHQFQCSLLFISLSCCGDSPNSDLCFNRFIFMHIYMQHMF